MDALALTPAVVAGEWWRLWTCHLAHYDAAHALTGMVACAVPLALLPRVARKEALLALLVVAPLVAAAVLHDAPSGEYRGASGLAAALWAYTGIARGRERVGNTQLGVLGVFQAREAVVGATVHDGWIACAAAHRAGALAGAVLALSLRRPEACPAPRIAAGSA